MPRRERTREEVARSVIQVAHTAINFAELGSRQCRRFLIVPRTIVD